MSDEPKRPGRPRLDDPRVISVSVYLSSKEYQDLLAEAKRDEVTLAAKLRDAFEKSRRHE
jgi:hypothetical protein